MASRDTSRPSWIGDAPEPPPRWGALLVLGLGLAVAIGLFIWLFAFSTPSPRTQFAVIEITLYGDSYPNLKPAWSSAFPSGGMSDKTGPNNAETVKELLKNIPTPSGEHKNQDTLLLVLRCHAAIDSNGDCSLLIGESELTHYSMRNFLKDALARGYKNTVVLADVCDLHYYPRLGYIVNPIVEALQKHCEEARDDLQGRDLWLLCATADGQRSFRDRNGSTLFQAGVLEALKLAKQQPDKPRDFSLREFYRSVCNYCGEHSQGLQTPILISAKDNAGPATDIRIAWRDPTNKSWFEPTNPGKEDGIGKEAGGSEPESNQVDASQSGVNIAGEKATPSTWDEVDQLRGDEAERDVRPLEIDPLRWRCALAIEAFNDATSPPVDSEKDAISDLRNDLRSQMEKLSKEPGKKLILDTWKAAETTPLTQEEKKQWSQVRKPLRDYMAFVAEWVAWRDLVLTFPHPKSGGPNSDRISPFLKKEFLEAAKALEKRREELNLRNLQCLNNNSNWLASIQPSNNSLGEARNPLRENLRRSIDQLAKSKPEKWSWLKEEQLLVLLQCPLVESPQRRKLVDLFHRTTNASKTLERDGPNRDWANETRNSPSEIEDRFLLFNDAMRAFVCGDLPNLESSPGAYTRWGRQYGNLYQNVSSANPLHRWHQLALLDFPADPSKMAIPNATATRTDFALFYPGNANQERLEVTPRDGEGKWIDLDSNVSKERKEKQFRISPRYVDPDKPIQNVKLRWRLERDSAKFVPAKPSGFKLRGEDNKDWKQGDLRPFSSSASLAVLLPGDSDSTDLGHVHDRLVFEWLDDQGHVLAKDAVPILVNAERLDMILRPVGDRDPVYPTRDGKLDFSFPAIEGSTVQLDVDLRNKIDKRRRARVIVTDGQSEGLEIARSKPVDWKTSASVPIEFEPTANPSPGSPPARTLVFRVEELEPPAESTEAPLPGTNKESKVLRAWSFRCLLNPGNPGLYVEADNKRSDATAKQAFDLPLQFKEPFWSSVTDADRIPMAVRWKRSNKTQWEETYQTSIPRRSIIPSVSGEIPKRPVLLPGKNELLFECDLGNYPRAVAYRLKCDLDESGAPKQPDLLEKIPAQKISKPAMKAIVKDHSPIEPTDYLDERIVFPTWHWTNWDNKGKQEQPPTQNKIQGLMVRAVDGIDAIDGKIHWSLDPRSNDPERGSFPDRSIIPEQLKWEGSRISFIPGIGEAEARIDSNLDDSTSTEYRFTLCTSKDCDEESSWSAKLIFDREKPREGILKGDGQLQGDRDFQLRLEWNDGEPDQGGSGIAEGYLAIRGPDQRRGPDRNKYDFGSRWKLKTKGKPSSDGTKAFIFDIKASDLESLNEDLPEGRIRINALIVDKAGNYQESHESLDLDWKPAPTKESP